jgi:hypothetical protein
MVVHEDIITFEWWDGDFISKLCKEEFTEYKNGCIGPENYIED